jgi:hypothetical protein
LSGTSIAEDAMPAKLEAALQAFDESRRALLDELELLSAETLGAKPFAGKWSILEIVEHLVLAEREVLQNLPEPSQMVELRRSLKTHFTYPMVMMVLMCRIPVKAPSSGMIPRGTSSLADLRRQWDQSQQWLRSYVDGLDRQGVDRAVFQHPVAGPLSVTQAVRMGRVHVATHTRQIRRLLSLMN